MSLLELAEVRNGPKVAGFPKVGLVVVAGDPKSGKSWLCASAPKSILIELEDMGADRIPFGKIIELRSTEEGLLDKFDTLMGEVMADDSIEIVIIDTVDKLAKLWQDDISKLHGTVNMVPKQGLDARILWGEFGDRVKVFSDACKNCGKLVVLIAHTRPPKQDEQGRVVNPEGINVQGQGGDYIVAQAEMLGKVGVRVVAGKAQHFITFRAPSNQAIWRTRVAEYADREIILDKENPWKSLIDAGTPAKVTPAKKTEARKK
jgi:hypothetical protein